jgi:hypothetical protein
MTFAVLAILFWFKGKDNYLLLTLIPPKNERPDEPRQD